MKLGFDLRERSSLRIVLRFALIAVILGFGVNAVLSLFMDPARFLASLHKVQVIYFIVPLLLFIASHFVDSLRLMLVVSQFTLFGDVSKGARPSFVDAMAPVPAEALYRRALAAWDRLGSGLAANRAVTAGNLGELLRTVGRYSEAEPLLLEWMRQAETARSDSLESARAAHSLAALYLAMGQLGKAEQYASRASRVFASCADASSEEKTASRRTLASVLLSSGRYAEGEAELREILEGLPDRLAVGAYNDLATAELRQNRIPEGEAYALRAVGLARRVLPAGHTLLAASLNNLAQAERFQARYLDAEQHYREAIAIWEEAFGRSHPEVAKGLMNLAAFYHERQRESGAEDLYRRATGIFQAAYGENHPLTLVSRNELGDVLRAQRRYSESEKLSRATLAPLEAALGERDPRVLRALSNYARLLEDTRHGSEAATVRSRIQTLGFR